MLPPMVFNRLVNKTALPFLLLCLLAPGYGYGEPVQETEEPKFSYRESTRHNILIPDPAPGRCADFSPPYDLEALDGDLEFLKGDPLNLTDPKEHSLRTTKTFQKADRLYDAGNFSKAAALYKKVLKKEPDNIVFEKYASALYWIDDRRKEACNLYKIFVAYLDAPQGVIIEDPSIHITIDYWFPNAYYKLASCYLDEREWEKAIYELGRSFSAMSSLSPAQKSQAIDFLAEAHYESGDFEHARYYVEKGLEINPEEPTCLRYKKLLDEKASETKASDNPVPTPTPSSPKPETEAK
jgi:tetratricopeptide (TPR) repeat protein